jgi:SAM-dependent methyltransferase
MKTNRLKDEAAAFDLQIRERIAHGHVPDLRRAQPCDWFYNNPWRRPEYIDSIFGEDFRFALAQIPPGSRILEVGSGPGHMALELARNGHRVTGVELSPECVRVARRMAAENPYRESFGSLSYAVGDIFTWECGERYQAICFFGVLHHFDNPGAVLDRVLGLLEPEGAIIAVEPARDWFSRLNAAVALLIRLLLSRSGRWHETLRLPGDTAQLGSLVDDCLAEYREQRDRDAPAQSPQDNSSYADGMLAALRERFDQTAFQNGHAFLPRMIGGVRGTEADALEMAAFLRLFDEYCVRSGLLMPGQFRFAGRKRTLGIPKTVS